MNFLDSALILLEAMFSICHGWTHTITLSVSTRGKCFTLFLVTKTMSLGDHSVSPSVSKFAHRPGTYQT